VHEFIESDFFDFIGTSSRSLSTNEKHAFSIRYNIITKDVIPFCEKIGSSDIPASKIAELWYELSQKFKNLIDKEIK
jgi:hypothetical protein